MSNAAKTDLQGQVIACPRCENARYFTVSTYRLTDEQCVAFLVCECGYDPTSDMEVVRRKVPWAASDAEKATEAVVSWNRGIDIDLTAEELEEWSMVSGCKRLAKILPEKSPFWNVWRAAAITALPTYEAKLPGMTPGKIVTRWGNTASRGFLEVTANADGTLLVSEPEEPMTDEEIEEWAKSMTVLFKDSPTLWTMWRNALIAAYPAFRAASPFNKIHGLASRWAFGARGGYLKIEINADRGLCVTVDQPHTRIGLS